MMTDDSEDSWWYLAVLIPLGLYKVGNVLRYADGAKVIRIEGYYLLRNWFFNGHYFDRIAIPVENVYFQ